MKKYLVGIGMSAMLATANVSAALVSGDLQLRDAMYLYDQGVDARGSKTLGSYNCDVFQLVLDVTSGYTDLGMGVGNASPLNSFVYPDRIHDSAAMFAYALSGNDTWKVFGFNDKGNPASSTQIGKGSIFGYCYSTKPDAYVYFRENDKCTVKFSNGSTESIPNCVPTSGSGSGSSPVPNDMSDLVGIYNQTVYFSSPGSQCAAYGALNGNYVVSFNITKSGNTLSLIGYTSTDTCHYTLNKVSGDSVSGYNLSGSAICASGFNTVSSANGVKKVGSKLVGTITASASGCTQTMTPQ